MTIKEKLKSESSARDVVFNHTLSYFEFTPAKILEIGCLRDLNSRAGDGWSTLHWANYIEENGGGLVFCDINRESVNLCLGLLEDSFPNVDYVGRVINGIYLINDGYNFIYLDGGDEPRDTLEQFEKCDVSSQFVLIDDYHTKGRMVDEKWKGNKTLFNFSNGHKMALFGKGVKNEEIFIQV